MKITDKEEISLEEVVTKLIVKSLQDVQTALLELAKDSKKIKKLIEENI